MDTDICFLYTSSIIIQYVTAVKHTFLYLGYLEYLSIRKKYIAEAASHPAWRQALGEPGTCVNRERAPNQKGGELFGFFGFGLAGVFLRRGRRCLLVG